jgi:LmbE family N-acetylglucosaminyl deacetylase
MIALVIAVHPDDEVLGCGGTIARHVALGHQVHVLVVTRGIPEIFSPDLIEHTRQELRAAHQILGVSSVRFLDFPAPRLDVVAGHELADAISATIRDLQAETVYLPHRGDLHADHRAVYEATLVAARPIKACPTHTLYCYETLSETDWAAPFPDSVFVPTVFVDITDYLNLKLRALACYESQLKAPPHPRSLEAVEGLARLRGATVGLAAAEAFVLVRTLIV